MPISRSIFNLFDVEFYNLTSVDKDSFVAGSLGHFYRKCASFPAVISKFE
jgi:hypothetical protein